MNKCFYSLALRASVAAAAVAVVVGCSCRHDASTVQTVNSRASVKPVVPFDVAWEYDKGVVVGVSSEMTLCLTSEVKADLVKVNIIVPNNAALVAGDTAWQGTIAAGESRRITIKLLFGAADRYRLSGDVVFADSEGWKLRRKAIADIDLRKDTQMKAEDPGETHRHPAVPLDEYLRDRRAE